MITPIKPGAGSEKVRHSRESGNPETFVIEVDSRFRGNDEIFAKPASGSTERNNEPLFMQQSGQLNPSSIFLEQG